MDTAATADGLCPLCLYEKLTRLREAVEGIKISPVFNAYTPPRNASMVDAEGLEKLYTVLDSLNLNPKEESPLCVCGHPASDHHHLDECHGEDCGCKLYNQKEVTK